MEFRKIKSNFTHFVLSYTTEEWNIPSFPRMCMDHLDGDVLVAIHNEKGQCFGFRHDTISHEKHIHILLHRTDSVAKLGDVLKKLVKEKMDYECVLQQFTVWCPYSLYLNFLKLDQILASKGAIFDKFTLLGSSNKENVAPKAAVKCKKVWELQKLSTVHGKEQQVAKLMRGPKAGVLQQVLDIMEEGIGYLSVTSHSNKFLLEVGVTQYQCYCDECTGDILPL